MNFNSVQIGLLAILLSICGFMFMLSIQKDNYAVEVNKFGKFRGVCCLGCNPLVISLNGSGVISFEQSVVNKHQLVNHLKQHDLARPLTTISIIANESTNTQTVVELTDYIQGQLPEVMIGWSVKSAT